MLMKNNCPLFFFSIFGKISYISQLLWLSEITTKIKCCFQFHWNHINSTNGWRVRVIEKMATLALQLWSKRVNQSDEICPKHEIYSEPPNLVLKSCHPVLNLWEKDVRRVWIHIAHLACSKPLSWPPLIPQVNMRSHSYALTMQISFGSCSFSSLSEGTDVIIDRHKKSWLTALQTLWVWKTDDGTLSHNDLNCKLCACASTFSKRVLRGCYFGKVAYNQS